MVDLSNVCRSEDLGAEPDKANLSCLGILVRVVGDLLDGRAPVLLYVADDSLWPLLRQTHGERYIEEWQARNNRLLVTVPVADQSILQYSEGNDCPVLSMDQFRDWRRGFPWIQGNDDLFYGWRRGARGTIELFRRTMSVLTEEEMSRHEEERILKGQGLDQKREEYQIIAGTMYRCENPQCELREMHPYFLISPPRRDRRTNTLICEHCRQPVTEVGPVGPICQLKYEVSATGHSGRFTIYQRKPTTIGRRVLGSSLEARSAEDVEVLQKVSAEHLEFYAEGRTLFVTDTGSTNGTRVQRYDRKTSILGPPERLLQHEKTTFGPNDVLSLAGCVTVRRSGRQHRFDGLTQGEQETDSGPGGTRVASKGP